MSSWPIEDLVPHASPMCLVDKLVSFTETSVVVVAEIRADHPFLQPRGVPAHIGLEIMAQACAVWAGIEAREAGGDVQVGLLLGTRNCRISVPFFNVGDRLSVRADLVFREGGMGVFDCSIEVAGDRVAEASLNLYQPQDGNPSLRTGMATA
jgi:predicted hotdog family 3-hydroxylacyl-ACP dehydratase